MLMRSISQLPVGQPVTLSEAKLNRRFSRL